MGNSISSSVYDNLIIESRAITVNDAILSTENNHSVSVIFESVGNRLVARPDPVANRLVARPDGNRLAARPDMVRRSSTQRQQERVILVQEGNRLIVRSVTGIPQEQQASDALVSPSTTHNPRQILVQEGNRLIVRRVTGIPLESHEQQATDMSVSLSITPTPRQVDNSSSPYDYSQAKLSLLYSLHTLSDFERDALIAEGQSCSICFDDYTSSLSTVLRLPCGHTYHGACICQWISSAHRSCPTCRQMLLNF